MHSHSLFSLLLTGLVFIGFSTQADESALPGSGYVATRYEALWSKSPFSVASVEEGPSSPDYSLVGIAQFDGVSYATLINKQTQGHFLVASDKPSEGFTLISVTHGHDASGTSAVLQKDGQSMTLKLETAPVAGGPGPNMPPGMIPPSMNGGIPLPPGMIPPNMNGGIPANMVPMPGSQFGGQPPGGQQPPMPFRRRDRIIRIPPPPGETVPMPGQVAQPPGAPGQPNQAAQPGQPAPTQPTPPPAP